MVVSKPIYSVQIHVILPLPSKRCTNSGHSNNFLCKFMFFYHYYPKEGPRVSITKPISTVQRHALSSLFSSFDSGAVVTNPIFSEQNTWICRSYSTYGTYAEITKFLLAKIFYLSIEIMDRGRWFKKHFLHATTCFLALSFKIVTNCWLGNQFLPIKQMLHYHYRADIRMRWRLSRCAKNILPLLIQRWTLGVDY